MNNVGWKLKIVKAWQRMLASYLRGVAVALGTLGIANAATGKIDLSMLAALGWALIGAVIAPVIVFITESANIIEDQADDGEA